MRAVFILIIMLFLHVFADFHVQGILARLKQKSTVDSSTPGKDYIAALSAHAFEWSFIVTLPCLVSIFHACTDLSWPNIRLGAIYLALLLLNAMVHYAVDDMKVNDHKIGLLGDQTLHVIQIVYTWMSWVICVGW